MAKKAKKKKGQTKLTIISTDEDFENALDILERAIMKPRVSPKRKKK